MVKHFMMQVYERLSPVGADGRDWLVGALVKIDDAGVLYDRLAVLVQAIVESQLPEEIFPLTTIVELVIGIFQDERLEAPPPRGR